MEFEERIEMKIEELFIGAWVNTKHGYAKISSIYQAFSGYAHVSYIDADGIKYDCVTLDEIEPIELTSEILEKNGWKPYEPWYDRQAIPTYYLGCLNGSKIQQYEWEKTWRLYRTFDYHSPALRYVHELQKAYQLLHIENNIVI